MLSVGFEPANSRSYPVNFGGVTQLDRLTHPDGVNPNLTPFLAFSGAVTDGSALDRPDRKPHDLTVLISLRRKGPAAGRLAQRPKPLSAHYP
jgi:hypothetical protein